MVDWKNFEKAHKMTIEETQLNQAPHLTQIEHLNKTHQAITHLCILKRQAITLCPSRALHIWHCRGPLLKKKTKERKMALSFTCKSCSHKRTWTQDSRAFYSFWGHKHFHIDSLEERDGEWILIMVVGQSNVPLSKEYYWGYLLCVGYLKAFLISLPLNLLDFLVQVNRKGGKEGFSKREHPLLLCRLMSK